MSETMIVSVIAPVVLSVVGGIGCEHPNCPSRKLLAEYYKNKSDKSNE